MPRSTATLDEFAAVAEPRRREVLGALSTHERPVNELVGLLGWPQPQVSKHLAVLREVGLVDVRKMGRQRVYRVNGHRIKNIFDWAGSFEKLWEHQLARIKDRAEAMAKIQADRHHNNTDSRSKHVK